MGLLFFHGMPVIADSSADTAEPPGYSVTITGYNAVPEQTDDNPFTTASGAYANSEVVAARSRDLSDKLPFGTVIMIEGPAEIGRSCGYDAVQHEIGYRVIADTMNARYTNRIDILFASSARYTTASGKKDAGTVLGICEGVTVRSVGFVDLSRPGNLPNTQAALAALVEGAAKPLALK